MATMFNVAVTVTGDELLAGKMKAVSAATTGKNVLMATKAGALVIEEAAKELAPKDKGALVKSIQSVVVYSVLSGAKVAIWSDLEYAAQKEFGGPIVAKNAPFLVFQLKDGRWIRTREVWQDAQPFMRPAFDNYNEEAAVVIHERFWALMRTAWLKGGGGK